MLFSQCDGMIEASFGVGVVVRVFRVGKLFEEFKWREEAGGVARFSRLWNELCGCCDSTESLLNFM